MSETTDGTNKVSAFPSKAFFVGMLTRDIELKDAILDLLDNCVDGILRTIKNTAAADREKPYEGYWAELVLDEDLFCIKDNCGGIPRKVAEDHAFRLGRPDLERDKDLPTVGMYGIGMKRAIFKMGRSCTVTTRHGDEAYKVTISPEWLEDDDDWELPLEMVSASGMENGTTIEIGMLHDHVKHAFSPTKSPFVDDFKFTVSAHYSYIIHKGFSISVKIGDEPQDIAPRSIGIQFTSPDKAPDNQRLAPFIYEGTHNGVDINLIVGLYRELPGDEEIESDLEGRSGSSDNAGWTIICNDRVVVYCDKTRLTGWGEAGVPKYHTQFISITGVVHFRSTDAAKLPVTTTKRGIDGNSDTYLAVKDIMREGLKHFTSYTYKWKSPSTEREEITNNAESVDIFQVSKLIPEGSWAEVKRQDYTGKKYVPKLPAPVTDNGMKQIRFSRPTRDIKLVSEHVLGDPDQPASEVGAKCFDNYLKKAKAKK